MVAPSATPADAPPRPAPTRRPTLAHRVELAAVHALTGALTRLGRARALAVGGWLGRVAYYLGVRRRVALRQIAAALPELDPRAVRSVARESFAHLGRVAIETMLLSRATAADVLAMIERVEGWSFVERDLALGRGLVVLSAHCGNWELAGAYGASRGITMEVVVRLMGNPLFDAELNEARARLGMLPMRDRDSVRRTPRALAANHAVCFLSDQAGLHIASSFVPFFGRPAKTPRGPAVFALRARAPILFGAAMRQPSGRYVLFIEEIPLPESGDRERDVELVLTAYTQCVERYVRRYPEQYFWQHRRWKRQPPDTPPAWRDPAA